MEKCNCVQSLRLNSRLRKIPERSATFYFCKTFNLLNSSFFWDWYKVAQRFFRSCLFLHKFRLQCYQTTIINLNKSIWSFRISWELIMVLLMVIVVQIWISHRQTHSTTFGNGSTFLTEFFTHISYVLTWRSTK